MKEHRSLHLVTSSVPMSCSPRKGEIETLFRKKKKAWFAISSISLKYIRYVYS